MKHLSICNFGDCLGVSGNRLTVRSKEGELQEYCLTHLRSICIAKNGISISSNLVQACAARGIRLYFLDWTGKSTAYISGEHQHAVVQVRKAQFRAIESVLSHFLSREIILAKLRNQRAVLLYFQKYQAKAFPEKAALFHLAMDRIEHLHDHLKTLDHLMQTDEWRTVLLGYEGQAAEVYWRTLRTSGLLPSSFQKREGRGSLEVTNAALNYGYSILEKFCWSALENAGLELYAGLLHVDRPGKPSLVLDFMEEYRAWVVDRNIIKLRARLGKETSLTPDLKTEIINGIDATMSAFITHRGKKVRLENIMQRQAYRLAGAMTDGKRYKSISFKW